MLRVCIAAWATMLAASAYGEAPASDHPLLPVLRMAYDGYQHIDQEIDDYTCIMTKRERVKGYLRPHETMFAKVRHQQVRNGRVATPFSVYLRFLGPTKLRGREVLYVHGKNAGRLIVRNGGTRFAYITTSVAADSSAAMQENRYPITEIGVKNLTRRLIENGEAELRQEDVGVKIVSGARINSRPCTLVQVSHPTPSDGLAYQYARIFIDEELGLPMRYAAYDWPEEEGGESLLLEEYTYTNVKLNVGLTDWDFDHKNENYQFLKTFTPHRRVAVAE